MTPFTIDVGPCAFPYVCDQRKPSAIQAMARQVLADHGTPSILVNNAGIFGKAPVEEMS